jgi:hypothetical protein
MIQTIPLMYYIIKILLYNLFGQSSCAMLSKYYRLIYLVKLHLEIRVRLIYGNKGSIILTPFYFNLPFRQIYVPY